MDWIDGFDDNDSRKSWDYAAGAWDAFVRSGGDYSRVDVFGPAMLKTCLPVKGLKALDIGCGQGYFSRSLARAGAQVTAFDISPKMIEKALEYEQNEPLGIDYAVYSTSEMADRFTHESFDLITACMVLMDVSEPEKTLQASSRLLKKNGRMIFSIPHPTFDVEGREWQKDENGQRTAMIIRSYFKEGAVSCPWDFDRLEYPWESPGWRFTMQTWSKMIDNAGFAIKRIYEPRPTKKQVQGKPHLGFMGEIPTSLIFVLTRCI